MAKHLDQNQGENKTELYSSYIHKTKHYNHGKETSEWVEVGNQLDH